MVFQYYFTYIDDARSNTNQVYQCSWSITIVLDLGMKAKIE